MCFIALSFFFLCAKCCPFWCRHVEVTANDKVRRFLGHGVDMSNVYTVQCHWHLLTTVKQLERIHQPFFLLSLWRHSLAKLRYCYYAPRWVQNCLSVFVCLYLPYPIALAIGLYNSLYFCKSRNLCLLADLGNLMSKLCEIFCTCSCVSS